VLHAFLWEHDFMINLDPFLGPDIATFEPIAISDTGYIAGNGFLSNGDVHAVVLVPGRDCGELCEAKETTGPVVAGPRPRYSTMTEQSEEVGDSVDRFRKIMRRRYHMSNQAIHD
jgi:hypothetical protein